MAINDLWKRWNGTHYVGFKMRFSIGSGRKGKRKPILKQFLQSLKPWAKKIDEREIL